MSTHTSTCSTSCSSTWLPRVLLSLPRVFHMAATGDETTTTTTMPDGGYYLDPDAPYGRQ